MNTKLERHQYRAHLALHYQRLDLGRLLAQSYQAMDRLEGLKCIRWECKENFGSKEELTQHTVQVIKP